MSAYRDIITLMYIVGNEFPPIHGKIHHTCMVIFRTYNTAFETVVKFLLLLYLEILFSTRQNRIAENHRGVNRSSICCYIRAEITIVL